jgi:hypothetical protein
VVSSKIVLIIPSVSPSAIAFPLPRKGKRPTRIFRPFAFAALQSDRPRRPVGAK